MSVLLMNQYTDYLKSRSSQFSPSANSSRLQAIPRVVHEIIPCRSHQFAQRFSLRIAVTAAKLNKRRGDVAIEVEGSTNRSSWSKSSSPERFDAILRSDPPQYFIDLSVELFLGRKIPTLHLPNLIYYEHIT